MRILFLVFLTMIIKTQKIEMKKYMFFNKNF